VAADNLGSHKVAGVRAAIEARGASIRFLPSYSPDLNPIEQLFAKLKALIRALAPRSREALSQAIGYALEQVSPSECANYLANAGYGQSA
jgi:transposase